MIDWTWIRAAEDAPLMIVLSAVALYVLLILYNRLVDNAPLLLMDGPEVLSDNLRRAKLRAARRTPRPSTTRCSQTCRRDRNSGLGPGPERTINTGRV